jgi:acyl-CoA synthetase (AMP-forming)/AMP-acid ligase II
MAADVDGDAREGISAGAQGSEAAAAWSSIPALVEYAAREHAGREAVVGPRTRFDYAELGERVRAAAAAVIAAGVEPGDRVAIWAPNSPDYVVAALGAVSAGAVLVPLNTRLKGGEVAELCARTRSRLAFVTGHFLGQSYAAALRSARADRWPLPDLETCVLLGEQDGMPEGFTGWRDFLGSGRAVPEETVTARMRAVGPDDPADIMFTSGTTGRSKGAVATHGQTLRAFSTWADLAGLRAGDRYLIVNPFTHSFGYKAGILTCLMRGATILPQPVFDVDAVLAKIQSERVTVLPGAPTVYQSLLDAGARGLPVRLAVTGAAVVPLELVHRMRDELGIETVVTAYGLTESCGIVTMCRPDDPPETVAATSGRAIPGVRVRISPQGEIQVSGYPVMRAYFEEPEETERTFTSDGWLRTGDIGELDAEGNLRITDRMKDMFTVGGFNAYPAEIEQVLSRHPVVGDVAVVGVPDRRLGEVGKAYVVPAGGGEAGERGEELLAWARRELANYKVPRSVEFLEELPRNASGKVLKSELRQRQG